MRAMDRLLQVLVNAAAMYVAVLIVPGLEFTEGGEWWKFLLVAVAFSLLNSFLRPILRILTFPITIVTMGLFLLVINAAHAAADRRHQRAAPAGLHAWRTSGRHCSGRS